MSGKRALIQLCPAVELQFCLRRYASACVCTLGEKSSETGLSCPDRNRIGRIQDTAELCGRGGGGEKTIKLIWTFFCRQHSQSHQLLCERKKKKIETNPAAEAAVEAAISEKEIATKEEEGEITSSKFRALGFFPGKGEDGGGHIRGGREKSTLLLIAALRGSNQEQGAELRWKVWQRSNCRGQKGRRAGRQAANEPASFGNRREKYCS